MSQSGTTNTVVPESEPQVQEEEWQVTKEYVRTRPLASIPKNDQVYILSEKLRQYVNKVRFNGGPDPFFHRKSNKVVRTLSHTCAHKLSFRLFSPFFTVSWRTARTTTSRGLMARFLCQRAVCAQRGWPLATQGELQDLKLLCQEYVQVKVPRADPWKHEGHCCDRSAVGRGEGDVFFHFPVAICLRSQMLIRTTRYGRVEPAWSGLKR